MRPPICAICDRDFLGSISEGGSVQFKLTKSDIKSNQRLKYSKMTGHPAGLEWFCKGHYELAQKYSHLTKIEAITKIKK